MDPNRGNVLKTFGPNDMLVLCSLRYCLQRYTYIVPSFISWLKDNWDSLDRQTQMKIHDEVKQEISFGNPSDEWSEILEWKVKDE
jgi:hypothetical protein